MLNPPFSLSAFVKLMSFQHLKTLVIEAKLQGASMLLHGFRILTTKKRKAFWLAGEAANMAAQRRKCILLKGKSLVFTRVVAQPRHSECLIARTSNFISYRCENFTLNLLCRVTSQWISDCNGRYRHGSMAVSYSDTAMKRAMAMPVFW